MTAQVNTPTARYEALAKKRALPRTLMGGTTAMVEAGEKFLPKHPAESDQSYKVRLIGTTLYNGFSMAVSAQVGKVFSKPILVNSDVPDQIASLLPDIDGQGRELTPFMMNVFNGSMADGISYILVDFPILTSAPGARSPTLADQQAVGAKPYWVHITADQLIGWRQENVNGVQVLTEVRIMERSFEPDGEWGEQEQERVRVLRPNYFGVYKKEKSGPLAGEFLLEVEGVTSFNFVPLVPVYANRTGFYEGEPPLSSLADLNLEHWISSSEQRKALSFSRFAMLALTGVDTKSEVVVGSDKTMKLPMGATASYVEPTGAGVEAGRKDLEAIEARMQSAGMQLRVERGGMVTATAAAIDTQEANAGLKAVADGLGDSIELALFYTAKMLNLPNGGTVEISDEFAAPIAAGTTAELTSVLAVGALSLETYLTELKRRGILSDDLDVQDEIERIQGAAI